MLEWIQANERAVTALGALSLVTLLALPFLLTWIIVRIPEHYFIRERRPHPPPEARLDPVIRFLFVFLKNLLGALFVLAGVAMLVLPGQGILTILLGLSLMNFPGKYRLERWLVTRGATLRLANRLRRRHGRPPLVVPGSQ